MLIKGVLVMKSYKNILLAVELNPMCDNEPIHVALDMVDKFDAKITLLHAVEHMSSYGAAYGIAAGAGSGRGLCPLGSVLPAPPCYVRRPGSQCDGLECLAAWL